MSRCFCLWTSLRIRKRFIIYTQRTAGGWCRPDHEDMALLENERVCLRALEPEDLELLYRWENDSELWEVGNTLAPYSRYILREYIAGSDRSIYETRQLRLMVVERATGASAGLVDLFDFEPRPNRAACGILLDSCCQGRGLATEALRVLMDYAYTFLRLRQLYAHIPVANEPSKRLFMRCGFVESGVLRDWIRTRRGYSDVWVFQSFNDNMD